MQRHALTLAALVALSGAVQAWCIQHAVVPAQDSVRYVRMAQAIERDGLLSVLRRYQDQPLFPAAIWQTHTALEPFLGSTPDLWVTSAQVAAAVALVLAVIPLYGFLLCVVRQPAALAGAVFFCLIPAAARLGADGLSNSLHLCLFCVALWAAGRYFSERQRCRPNQNAAAALWLFVAGIAVAFAALARKEALILAPALCLVLLLLQTRGAWRQSWSGVAARGLCLGLGMALVCVPYLVACDTTHPRAAIARLLGHPRPELEPDAGRPQARRPSRWITADGQAMSFGKKDPEASLRFRGYLSALAEFCHELPDAFHYGFAPLVIAGAWTARRRGTRPIGVFLLVFALGYAWATIYFASHSGYLAARHLLPLVVITLGWAGEGVLALGRWMAQGLSLSVPPALLPRVGVVAVALACLPRTLAPLHAGREGHRQAAAWLVENSPADAVVLDTRGWSQLYTGLRTYCFDQTRTAMQSPQLAYIVLETDELHYESRRAQTLRELLELGGQCIGRFGGRQPGDKTVEIYSWHPERFAARWRRERLAN